ncbi:hypothetical protein [Escherichia phage IMM-001]|nr:hypothetical protein [Escherichia phage IMM-001]
MLREQSFFSCSSASPLIFIFKPPFFKNLSPRLCIIFCHEET